MESRSQASSPAPRHPAVSPRAAGTMWGSFWNVIRSSTAARSGVNKVSPASARPPPMMSVPGSRRVSAVTRPAASASTAFCQTSTAAGSPDSTAFAQSAASARGPRTRRPRPGSPRRRRPASPDSRAGRSCSRGRPGGRRCGRSRPRPRGRPPRWRPRCRWPRRSRCRAGRTGSGPCRARPRCVLGEPAGADVVAEGDRDGAQPLGEQGAQRYVAPAEVRGVHRDALGGVDDAGHGDPRGDGALAEVLLAVGPADPRRTRGSTR